VEEEEEDRIFQDSCQHDFILVFTKEKVARRKKPRFCLLDRDQEDKRR